MQFSLKFLFIITFELSYKAYKRDTEGRDMSDEEPSSSNGGAVPPEEGQTPPGASGGSPPNIQKLKASKKMKQAQAQVDELVDIMKFNVEKVLKRDHDLSQLDRRASDLEESASQFQQHAQPPAQQKKLRKYWWENFKMWIIIVVILLVIVIIIVTTTQNKVFGNSRVQFG